jgi:phenylpropionate dioxygenase-like ring-hydroxylating dioxygenase large terminal subunit
MLTALRPYWHVIAREADIGTAPSRHVLLGEPLVAWRGPEGVVVMKDLCIHRGAALSGGSIEDGTIRCPYHGWRYDAAGACVHIPSLPEGAPIPATARAIVHHARVAYGLVWVCLSDKPAAFPDFLAHAWDSPEYRTVYVHCYDWKTSAGRVAENAMDFSHFNFVHKGYTELADGPVIKPYEVARTPGGMTYTYDDGYLIREYVVEFPFLVHDRKRVVNPGGGATWSDRGEGRAGDVTLLSFLATPVDAARTHIHVLVTRNHSLERADSEFTGGFGAVMEQDRVIVETQRPEEIPLKLREELHLKLADAPAMLYRRMLREIDLPDSYMP